MTDKSQTSPNVAALHDDSTPADTANSPVSEASLPEYEAEAIRHLQRGLDKESIVKRLTDSGLSRATATTLTEKVWREHSSERRMNAYILLGVAVLLLLMAVVNLPLPLLNKLAIDHAIPAGDMLPLILLGVLAKFVWPPILKALEERKQKIADGEQARDFIYVKDLVDVCYFLMHHRHDSGIYNLGTGKARTFLDLTKAVFNALDKETNINF